jgi:hypothetical protein
MINKHIHFKGTGEIGVYPLGTHVCTTIGKRRKLLSL